MRKIMKVDVLKGTFNKRINRFVVSGKIGKKNIKAHLTNTGRLNDILKTGKEALFEKINGKKLKYRLFGLKDKGKYYNIIDTVYQNKVFEFLIKENVLDIGNCEILKRNPKIGNSVFDFLLSCEDREIIVETKSAVLRDKNIAMYPDCPSIRGRRHVEELINLHEKGKDVLLVFIAALPFVDYFKPYETGDKVLAELIYKAWKKGVKILSFSIFSDEKGSIYFDKKLSFYRKSF